MCYRRVSLVIFCIDLDCVGKRILEEIFFSSQCPGFFSLHVASFCGPYEQGLRWNELHLLTGDLH